MKLTNIQAKAILKQLGFALMSRSLHEIHLKNSTLQMFSDDFAGVTYSYFVFNLNDKTVREGNWFDIGGKSKFRYYDKPAMDYSSLLK